MKKLKASEIWIEPDDIAHMTFDGFLVIRMKDDKYREKPNDPNIRLLGVKEQENEAVCDSTDSGRPVVSGS